MRTRPSVYLTRAPEDTPARLVICGEHTGGHHRVLRGWGDVTELQAVCVLGILVATEAEDRKRVVRPFRAQQQLDPGARTAIYGWQNPA